MTKDEMARLDFWAVRHQWINSPTETKWVRYSDYAALLARAEAAEAERDRQYDENVHRIRMEASAYTRGRGDGLREAAKVARSEGVYHELNVYGGGPDWYKHGQRIAAAILALIEKPEGEG